MTKYVKHQKQYSVYSNYFRNQHLLVF